MSGRKFRETDLYGPLKSYLGDQCYVVKAEIGTADIVACRREDDPVIVEIKTGFTLSLFHQAIARQAISDAVHVAVPRGMGRTFVRSLRSNHALARRLGLSLITVRCEDGLVEVHCDLAPFRPRQAKKRRARLLREFARRVGNPNRGGATLPVLVTAYRQDALRCAAYLKANGPTKGAQVAQATDVTNATRLMANDHYGWFERLSLGVYALTPRGLTGLTNYAHAIAETDMAAGTG